MKELPIILSPDDVKAVLAGTKTQVRRVVKPQPKVELFPFIGADNKPTHEFAFVDYPRVVSKHVRCPYGVPGDRLWVRETWREYYASGSEYHGYEAGIEYRAGGSRIIEVPHM